MLLRLSAAVAALAVIAAAGCGGEDAKRSETTPQHRGSPPAVRFAGGEVPGTLYIAAGPDDFNADLYRIRGSVADAVRLTFGGRISTVSAGPDASSRRTRAARAAIEPRCCGSTGRARAPAA